MADLRGQQLKDSYQDVVTRGTGNKLENGNGVEFADLDDKASLSMFESGTWTPVFRGRDTAGDYGLIISKSIYFRISTQVFIQCRFEIDSEQSAGEGDVEVSGLPFPVLGRADIPCNVILRSQSNYTQTLFFGTDSDTIRLAGIKSDGSPSLITISQFDFTGTNPSIVINAFYEID